MVIDKFKFLVVVALTGFFGDLFLQFCVKYLGFDWGLEQYFSEHGTAESLTLGAGLMTILFVIYFIFPFEINYINLAIYGIVLDIIFRQTMIFQSLTDYYNVQNHFETMIIGGALPVMLPLFIYQLVVGM